MAGKKGTAPNYAPPDRMVGEAERRLITRYSRQQWWRLEQAGQAPRRIQLGANKIGWLESELLAWIREKAAQRDQRAMEAEPCPGTAAE